MSSRSSSAAVGLAFVIGMLALSMFCGSVAADSPRGDEDTDALVPMAPVKLNGEELFRVRGVATFPAEMRADAISQRLRTLAGNAAIPADSLRVVEFGDHFRIVAGDEILMRVYDEDSSVEDVSRSNLANAIRNRMASAVLTYRNDRQPRVLLRKTAWVLAATAVLLIGLFVIRRGLRRLDGVIERRYRSKLRGLQIQTFQVIHAEQLWVVALGLLRLVRVVALLVLVVAYAEFVLGIYPWTRSLAVRGGSLLLDPLRTMGRAVLASIPNLVFIALIIVVTRYVLKLTRLFFDGIQHQTLTFAGFDPDWAMPTYRIVRLLMLVFAVVVAYPYIPGSNTAAFKGLSVFLGIILSLGSSSVISNIIAGYTMTYRRAFKLGDRVRIGEVLGEVTEMRVMVTHVRSIKNEEVVIPNSTILQTHVINYSTLARQHGIILHTTVGIGYETPWRQVEAMLLLAAERTPGLLREPPPFVLQKGLGDFCVTYEINVYCDQPQLMPRLYTALHQSILDVFNEYGVQIMTPAYEGDPEQPKVVPREQWFARPAQPQAPEPLLPGPS